MRMAGFGARPWAALLGCALFGWPFTLHAQEKAKGSDEAAQQPPAAPSSDKPKSQDSRPADASPLNPEANEFPSGPPAALPPSFDQLLADIAALRGRVAALMTSLFTSKLEVEVQNDSDDARVVSLLVTLDGGVIYSSDSLLGDDAKKVYEHSVAPGHHVLGVQIERVDARAKEFRSFQESRFSIVVPDKKHLLASFTLQDDSDMGDSFPDSEAGEYQLEVDLYAHVVE